MPEDLSSTTDQNHCQCASVISEPDNSKTRPRVFTFAKWFRRIGYLFLILTFAWIFLYHFITWNHFRTNNYSRIEPSLIIGTQVAFYLLQISFVVIALSIEISSIAKRGNIIKYYDTNPNECCYTTKYIAILLWWILIIIGVTFVCVNVLGYTSKDQYGGILHLWGWPITHSAFVISFYAPADSDKLTFSIRFFSTYWAMVDFFIGVIVFFCVMRAVKYSISRWSTKKQYSIKEILVLVTSAAFFMSFMTIERFNQYNDMYITEDHHKYQPLHTLPLNIQIPILIGVTCTLMIIGAAFFELAGLAITKVFRLDDEIE
jgi:hypothetical protein